MGFDWCVAKISQRSSQSHNKGEIWRHILGGHIFTNTQNVAKHANDLMVGITADSDHTIKWTQILTTEILFTSFFIIIFFIIDFTKRPSWNFRMVAAGKIDKYFIVFFGQDVIDKINYGSYAFRFSLN